MAIAPSFKDKEGYPSISSHITRSTYNLPIANLAALHVQGQQVGAIGVIPMSASQIGTGITIEQIVIVDQEHLEPDLNLVVFNDNPGGFIFTNGNYPSVGLSNIANVAGIIPIRAASGHWNALYSGAATKSWSIATVQPFLSFTYGYTNSGVATPTSFYVMLFANSSVTWTGANKVNLQITYRQG